jgi:hypothetical protein
VVLDIDGEVRAAGELAGSREVGSRAMECPNVAPSLKGCSLPLFHSLSATHASERVLFYRNSSRMAVWNWSQSLGTVPIDSATCLLLVVRLQLRASFLETLLAAVLFYLR